MSDTISRHTLRFPQRSNEGVDQDAERVEVRVDGEWRCIRFHDYHEIYEIPGLYEQLFYDELCCQSPEVVCAELAWRMAERGMPPEALRVLDVGAGNGMVGECLREQDAEHIVGADIIEEAAMAAERDRPQVYDDYLVADLTDLSEEDDRALADSDFNCMVTVAALGFGDLPPDAFAVAFNHVRPGGLVAMNIRDRFLEEGDDSGFAGFVRRAIADGSMKELSRRRYRHRLSVCGEELYYIAVVLEKGKDIALRSSDR